eukprot:3490698-Prymnesium_polylepis.1
MSTAASGAASQERCCGRKADASGSVPDPLSCALKHTQPGCSAVTIERASPTGTSAIDLMAL